MQLATFPDKICMYGLKGEHLTEMSFTEAVVEYDAPSWDFHRADLHNILLERAQELGATFRTSARVVHIQCETADPNTATIILTHGEHLIANLVVGADGIFSNCRDILLGRHDPPLATGDLAYILLSNTADMAKDPDLAPFIEQPHRTLSDGPRSARCQLRSSSWNFIPHGSPRA